ncbi:MAG: hypothetical protein ACLQLG_18625 [Thermoguttaceae bacterium]
MVMPSQTITRLDLTSTFYEFDLKMSRKGFIAPRVVRPRFVGIQAADVGKIDIGDLLQARDTKRAAGGAYKRSDFKLDKFSYSTEEEGAEEPIDDRNLKIYSDIFDAEAVHAARAEDAVMRNYETEVAGLIFNTAVFGAGQQYAAGTMLSLSSANAKWSNLANCSPIEDVEGARRNVILTGGCVPNAVILSRNNFWNAANSAEVVQRLKYSGIDDPKQVTLNAMAEVWQVEHVLVAGGIYAANNEAQAFSGAFIWGDSYVGVARVAETDDPREVCIGRTFMWEANGAGAPGTQEEIACLIEEYREESRRGSVIRARTDWDVVLMYPQAGTLITGTN